MLGSMLDFHFTRIGLPMVRVRRFDASAPWDSSALNGIVAGDVVVNCIGVINRFCRDDDPDGIRRAAMVNAAFPHLLLREVERRGARLVQIATDCAYSGRTGAYTELVKRDPRDIYGMSKCLGELRSPAALNIRCSIIGPEAPDRGYSLLEWFVSHRSGSEVPGYTDHRWNGVTTLQFARLCASFVLNNSLFEQCRAQSHTHHFTPNEAVSKFELLQILQAILAPQLHVVACESEDPVDRTLATIYSTLGDVFGVESIALAVEEIARNNERYIRHLSGL